MAQHQRITLQRIERLLDRLSSDEKYVFEDLLRVLVAIDATLVKHEHTDIARRLRKAFDKAEDTL